MSNNVLHLTNDDLMTILAAQEIIWERRLWERMTQKVKLPFRRLDQRVAIPINLVYKELNELYKLKTLRARYVRRVHVDPECAKAVAKICRENAKLAAGIART